MSQKVTMPSVIAALSIVAGIVAGIILSRPSSPEKVAAPPVQAVVKEGPVSTLAVKDLPELANPNAVTPSEETAPSIEPAKTEAVPTAKSPANPSPQSKPA